MAYRIIFATSVKAQMQALTAAQRKVVLDAIEHNLVHEPLAETRNRKLLRPNPIAPWELRIGQLRVFYDVVLASDEASTDTGEVQILAVGQKRGNVLRIGGKQVEL
jgi:mRNA-degrading endonuclease RelE of RelBE toxin-antitoxin system